MAVGNIYFISAIAVIGGGLFGFDISSLSAILPIKPYKCYFAEGGAIPLSDDCQGPSSMTQGGITAAMPGGSWLASLISGYLSDILGRKTSIQVGSIIWIIGSIISCASQNIAMLIVGRIINGFAVGICSAQVPVYIAELAPPSIRGRLVGTQQWAITWGILIMFYISYGCSFLKSEAAFRIPWGLQMIPGILLCIGMVFLPESPRWLARKERWEECRAVLVLVHGKGDPDSPYVRKEFAEIEETVNFERQNADVTYLELFKPRMINRTHIGMFDQIWAQLTGMNVMMYYITYVFQMTGQSGSTLLVSSSIQYIINVVMTVPALIFVDRWGRRPTLLIGAALMAIWLFANAGIFATYGVHIPEGVDGTREASMLVTGAPAKAIIACSYLFVASYAPTWGPVSWIYPPELFPLRVRGKAVALSTSANWAFNFALAWFVPPAFVNITWRVYIIFGVFCLAMFFHVFFLFPETAGKTLEQVVDIFENERPGSVKFIGTPAWKTRNSWKHGRKMEAGHLDDEGQAGLEQPVIAEKDGVSMDDKVQDERIHA
ncbi:putative transporter [Eremomyces bilateralis CBS 781.70]|uniref:Transporter n=1 Tax=Eremomyces bilateralis CBS 781.70 TaxID=1392243 RepID=A0A6G1GCH9_9PEZI|nr:putative transporter [Eremomyces bilateralis CBS 781.70]KAF1815626.1 putative transporter [Eremomyces bilateralis CBS 781.70]